MDTTDIDTIEYRRKHELSQRELAALLEVNVRTVQRYERGHRPSSPQPWQHRFLEMCDNHIPTPFPNPLRRKVPATDLDPRVASLVMERLKLQDLALIITNRMHHLDEQIANLTKE